MEKSIPKRENWGSRIGFIMAAAGSAVGLGNIWRFPYLLGENGGAAFLLIYLVFVVFIGISIMIAEFAVGRNSGSAAVGAYKSKSGKWTFAGVIGVLSAFFIMGFYPVVGGWSLAYIAQTFTGLLSNPEAIGGTFGAFIGSTTAPLIWMIVFLALNVFIVARGIAGGIEKAGKILMPVLFGLLVLIAIRSLTLPGAAAGLSYMFKPDFSAVTGQTYLAALGQAFFSLSLGMGCMITYGSYLNKKEDLATNAVLVTGMDVGVALLAGLAMFPAIFALGMAPDAGPGLVFVVIPSVFAAMGGIGPILSVIFFVALTVAALTSSVSLMEVAVAYFIDEKGIERKKAVYSVASAMGVLSILSSLSLGSMSGVTLFGVGFFDFFDILTDKIFLSIGGLLLSVFVGWFLDKEMLRKELTNGGTVKFALFEAWHFLIKYVIPVAISIVAFYGIKSIEQTSLMIFGLLMIVVLAVFSKKL
ncbi:sodium:neurotransmitter symporter [Alkaliphilus metalliredigens QYMF]|uniref:Transporter n=1 Tax=Alkaliphilus metalliredigens (strain QYMF) TaxID=293826 RepID=A6TK54_ALKMQ|nr:sodium-dependent transporter [Alkaliphilus metalliredigens]ABR46572.1 sodium:neurotransmitter symporter [Alkaliphilus metalliredigens QYMF]